MRRILIATHNAGKLREFADLLAPIGWQVAGAGALGLGEVAETGASFAENAQIKAVAAAKATGMTALADDSGLCVAALGGGPGVHAARYAAGDYGTAFTRIIAAAQATGQWQAWFTCALCRAEPDGTTATYIGQVQGRIAPAPEGDGGFGYDPIFIPLGFDHSFAVLGPEVKDKISHRARAVAQIAAVLR